MPGSGEKEIGLVDVPQLQLIRGVAFASGITFRQVVVTGPPGTGKTTLVTQIGGWPDEGFVDLTQRNWWRSRILAFRPRQIHLGLPFDGYADALSTFEREWVEATARPRLELDRIVLPPLGRWRNPRKWRHKYVFEFLLPPAQKVFEVRRQRSDRRSHAIDEEVSVERVREQLDVYWTVARHFHRAGMLVYVRDDFGAPPRVIDEEINDSAAESASDRQNGPGRSWLHHYFRQFTSTAGDRVVTGSRRVHLAGSRARVARSTLPIELVNGSRKLRLYDEAGTDTLDPQFAQSVRIVDSDAYFTQVTDFVRLHEGDSIRIRQIRDGTLPVDPEGGFPRVEIANDGDTIAITDLESPTGTVIVPLNDPAETHRLERDRLERVERVRHLLNGLPPVLDNASAEAALDRALERMDRNPWRPRDSRGRPGGLVELPAGIVPIVVGDLHANLANLVNVLSEGRFLDALERAEATVIVLGDAVHPEEGADLREMDSSLAMMDAIIQLIAHFGEHFIYLCGNHDSFSGDVTKQGIPQGRLWRETVEQRRGAAYLERMEQFYDNLPYVVAGDGFITCHAGPPVEAVTREKLIDIHQYPHFRYQLTWNRIQTPRNPGGYTKRDVRSLQKALGMAKTAAVIVSHNPREGEDTAVVELGGVVGHHLVYSAKPDRVSIFTRVGARVVPLTYPGRSLPDRSIVLNEVNP